MMNWCLSHLDKCSVRFKKKKRSYGFIYVYLCSLAFGSHSSVFLMFKLAELKEALSNLPLSPSNVTLLPPLLTPLLSVNKGLQTRLRNSQS